MKLIPLLLCLALFGCVAETTVTHKQKQVHKLSEKIVAPGGLYPEMSVDEYVNRMRMNERSNSALRTENGDYYYIFKQRCQVLTQKENDKIKQLTYMFNNNDYATLHKMYLDWKNYFFDLYGQAVINQNNRLKWIIDDNVVELYYLADQNMVYAKFYKK
jgi:hypothetical protein